MSIASDPWTAEFAERVYALLVEHAGARDDEDEKSSFVFHQTRQDHELPTEWRFCGKLGFGGKLWRRSYGKPDLYVTCYGEDETPERTRIIEVTNRALEELCRTANVP